MEDEIDMLSVFERFAAIEGSYSLVQDHIADMTEGSSFVRSLSNEEYSMACLPTFGAPSIATKWPTFQPVVHRVLRSSFSFDEVFSAIKDESFRDPFVEYIHAICYSYDHYFHFRDTIPETLNEREGFADTTWSIIRGALKLANVSSRFLEVPVVGVEVRKNANKNLLEEIKEQAHQADGVGYLDSERSQIYLAESSVLHLPDTRKRILDEIKVKRDMRDTLIAQLAEFSRESLPPRGFSVFGSTSFGPHTKFYQMDIAGVFRVYQVGSMLIPLTKEGFASKLRRCITTALRFALRIGDERDRRLMAEDLSELDKQRLQRACSQVSQTSKTPTGGRNQKKKQ
ncbi:hypothetical protein EC957_003965 [Mortierella hygrophila]|uniref:Uncharacterized protein n=1 Tax=Mortierella hygrophila TaxID=979708 RepID=A0A9P6F308_9FUNG|nr:hypothetical protein EC957_003965 [Mortierella hygrophila]